MQGSVHTPQSAVATHGGGSGHTCAHLHEDALQRCRQAPLRRVSHVHHGLRAAQHPMRLQADAAALQRIAIATVGQDQGARANSPHLAQPGHAVQELHPSVRVAHSNARVLKACRYVACVYVQQFARACVRSRVWLQRQAPRAYNAATNLPAAREVEAHLHPPPVPPPQARRMAVRGRGCRRRGGRRLRAQLCVHRCGGKRAIAAPMPAACVLDCTH